MSSGQFSLNQLVVHHQRICRITGVDNLHQPLQYTLALVAYLQDEMQRIAEAPASTAETRAIENELSPFLYSPPRYQLGQRLSDGGTIYFIYFSRYREYRYNLEKDNSFRVNLPEDEMHLYI